MRRHPAMTARHRLLTGLALVLLLALATGSARAVAAGIGAPGELDPLAKPTTRLGPHFLVSLDVTIRGLDETELCHEFALDADGRLQLTVGGKPIEALPLTGLTAAEAAERIKTAVARFYAVPPDVRVGIARIPRIKVTVRGATFRNGPVTLAEGARLSDALIATGYAPNADLEHVRVERVGADLQRATLTADFAKALRGEGDRFSDPALENGDNITLGALAAPVVQRVVRVDGEVRRPGAYPYKSGMTVRDALRAALDLTPAADPETVTILRAAHNGREIVNARRALAGNPIDNLPLQPDDAVVVARKDTGRRYAVVGAVVNPTTFDYTGRPTLKQAIIDCGGFKPDADRSNVLLTRNWLSDPAHPNTVPIDYDKLAKGEQPDIPLEAGDVVQVVQKKKARSPLLDIGLFVLRRFLPFPF